MSDQSEKNVIAQRLAGVLEHVRPVSGKYLVPSDLLQQAVDALTQQPRVSTQLNDWDPKLPPLILTLAELPDYVKPAVEAYGRACARVGRDTALALVKGDPA